MRQYPIETPTRPKAHHMFDDCPAIALVTNEEWNQLCAYAEAHDAERGESDEDCLLECNGTIQVCEIRPQEKGPARTGATRTLYLAEEPPTAIEKLNSLPPELVQKLATLSEHPGLIVRVLDSVNPTPEEEAATMSIAEATQYFFQLFTRTTGRPYS